MTDLLTPTSSVPPAVEPAVEPERPAILVVDDELGFREALRRVLGNRGYVAETAANGEQALDLASRKPFGLALVDLKMPGIDGFEVIERLRTISPQTLCIVVSAFATVESAVQSTKKGAFDFVVKPFVPDDLMVVVRRAEERWRLAAEAERLRQERDAHLLEIATEKSRLRTIIESMADGVLVVNIDAEVVLDNPEARRLLGRVSTPRLSGLVADVVPDDTVVREIRGMLDRVDALPVTREVKLPAPGTEGGERFLRATLAPISEETEGLDVRPLGVVVILTDVTEAKAFERVKSLFVSMVAHELKAPIGAVESYLELIRMGALDGDPDRLKSVAERCLLRTRSLLDLIRDLTEITRREGGFAERRWQRIDLSAFLAEMVEFQSAQAASQKIALHLEPSTTPLHVVADRGDIERIITNLLSNAIKYNVPGGRVELRARATGGTVVIEVTDTGVGMSPADVARLGEEFFRAKNPTTRTVTGTGLGVALVKRVVDSYHGALEVESTLGKGSTFRVVLPSTPSRQMETKGASA
jgi:signal transduction histidine kinase/ActR/RegA family two-component response regulator